MEDVPSFLRKHGVLLVVLFSYLGALAIVLRRGVDLIVDEWIYVRAAEAFATTGSIEISPLSIPVAVFEAVYGGIALRLFGESLPVLVGATAALSLFGAVALYDLVRRSGATSLVGALAAGMLLFTPVFFGLSSTYMTDAHTVSLVVIAAAVFSRGADRGHPVPWILAAGSIVTVLAYLSRPAGIVVALGALWVLGRGRHWLAAATAVALPGAVAIAHFAYQMVNGVPAGRELLAQEATFPTMSSLVGAAGTTTVQAGMWLLPLAPIAFAVVWRFRARRESRLTFLLLGLTLLLLFVALGPPKLGDWLNVTGLFPLDGSTGGGRIGLIPGPWWLAVVVVVSLVIAAVGGMSVGRSGPTGVQSALVGLWTFGIASVALNFVGLQATNGQLLDRYVVVLLPAVLLTVAGFVPLNLTWIQWASAFAVLVLVAALSLSLALDGLAEQQAVWSLADGAVDSGVAVEHVDGGAAWVGWNMGDLIDPERLELPNNEYWWRTLFGPWIEPTHVVTFSSLDGSCEVKRIVVPQLIGPDQPVLLVDTSC